MKLDKRFIPSRIVLPAFAVAVSWINTAPASAQFYAKQYAVVIGINQYQATQWQALSYARNDAEGIAALMQQLGFKVYSLYDRQATKANILSLLEDEVARQVGKDDALFFFFAGHGTTEHLGGKTWGYIVPSDAGANSSSYVSMEELVTLSEKMGTAKHQLFVMDCCFGGLLGKERAGGISEQRADYLRQISTRVARQILTAGGEDQQVADGGPYGHSLFTGHLIKGIKEGDADLNGDGLVPFSELAAYIGPLATTRYQTPGVSTLPRHNQGEFLFSSLKQAPPLSEPKPLQPDTFLRSAPTTLSEGQVRQMLVDKGFFDGDLNKSGNGIKHQYRSITRQGQAIVVDDATGLMWQQSGSPDYMKFGDEAQYIRNLNNQGFAGYSNWRLPTLEEAMSLMEPTQKNGDLYIDPVFDKTQMWTWTADPVSAGRAWIASFKDGYCYWSDVNRDYTVRAVRSGE